MGGKKKINGRTSFIFTKEHPPPKKARPQNTVLSLNIYAYIYFKFPRIYILIP